MVPDSKEILTLDLIDHIFSNLKFFKNKFKFAPHYSGKLLDEVSKFVSSPKLQRIITVSRYCINCPNDKRYLIVDVMFKNWIFVSFVVSSNTGGVSISRNWFSLEKLATLKQINRPWKFFRPSLHGVHPPVGISHGSVLHSFHLGTFVPLFCPT